VKFSFLKNTNTFFGRNNYLLVAAAWLFTISFIIDNYWSSTSTTRALQRKIQRQVIQTEQKSNAFFNNTDLINKIINGSYDETELDALMDKDYFIFIYKLAPFNQPQLVFWNTQIAVPDTAVLNKPGGMYFKKLLNGYYVITKKSYQNPAGLLYEIVSMIPVKWDYYVQNQYLKNYFVGAPEVHDEYDVSNTPANARITSTTGETLFYLKKVKNTVNHDNPYSTLLRILGTILILFFIQKLARFYLEKKGFLFSFFILLIPVLLLRVLSYFLPIPLNFAQYDLFSPTIYHSDPVLRSLGDLLINSILFIWMVLFVRFNYRFTYRAVLFDTKVKRYLIVGIVSLLMVISTLICSHIVSSLVSDSQISFDVLNFFTLNIYSVIGFIVLSCIATGYFFIIQILMHPLRRAVHANWFIFYVSVAIIGLIFLSFEFHAPHVTFYLCVLVWLLGFIYLLSKISLVIDAYNLVSSRFIFWLFFFSVSITLVIIIQNREKEIEERKNVAINLANRTDPSGENIVNIILTDFSNEALKGIFDRFRNPYENKFLKDSLINENFLGYLNKYDTRIYTFDSSENPLFNEDSTTFNSLNAIIQTQGKPTGTPDLFYYDISYDRFNYISKKEITDSLHRKEGYIFIISTPKKYKSDALYPALFSKGDVNTIENSPIYATAIYNNNQLTSSNNSDYPFPTIIDPSIFTYNQFRIVQRKSYEELWYRADADKVIVIARQNHFFIESITLFAYLFCSFLVITVLFNFLNKILRNRKENFKSFWQLSIRNQVHGTIILISIFSFLIIGITTILFFISRYHSNNRERLSRTIHIMEGEIRRSIDTLSIGGKSLDEFDSADVNNLRETVNRLSDIHATDVNIYDLDGNLKVSSLPLPYTKGIVSKKMDPVAFFHLNELKDVQYSQEQMIGSLEYLSNYVPVRDESGKEYAFLNIPYFESQNNLQDEISNFLVTIINLNAFIFLIAGIIALFIANRITRSFSVISNKMKELNLQKTNEEIVWTRRDEIGELVNEYNKMVHKLDVSAQLLAKSEREGAWREMARQVAHEIKNPLTPMKLNLQYLQMAIDNNSPGVKKISAYVANILLEQIDHLSKIASDFAQFANIGNSKNLLFDVNATLQNVASLYSTNDHLQVNTKLHQGEIIIEADKTQINRLFTNLLQNAAQAIPEGRQGVIEIESKLVENRVRVSVRDNGNGIPLQMQQKIFIPNFTTKTSGTGLGLAMCKGIVEKMNGKIWFETKEGEWTVFYVELPVVEE